MKPETRARISTVIRPSSRPDTAAVAAAAALDATTLDAPAAYASPGNGAPKAKRQSHTGKAYAQRDAPIADEVSQIDLKSDQEEE